MGMVVWCCQITPSQTAGKNYFGTLDLHLHRLPVLLDPEGQDAGSESQLRQLPVAARRGRGVD
jgi:hypothetical protein